MHWAHAVSTDLIHWEELPVTFYPDEYGTMYTGCAVVDKNNSSGLFVDENGQATSTGGIVTFLTANGNGQRIITAYSADGRIWKKKDGVILDWTEDYFYDDAFRDPKVFRYQNKWFMVIAGGPLRIYSSDNLLDWSIESTYSDINTECPDLMRLPVIDNGQIVEYKWLLSRAGRTYKIGNFLQNAGKWQFIPDVQYTNADGIMNFGKDAYALQTYYQGEFDNNQSRVMAITWMNSWDYSSHNDQPFRNDIYNGSFTMLNELSLYKNSSGKYLLQQKPIDEYKTLRQDENKISEVNKIIENAYYQYGISAKSFEIDAEFTINDASNVGFRINTENGYINVGYWKPGNNYYIDRRNAGIGNSNYTVESAVPATTAITDKIKLHIFVDRNSVDLFADNNMVSGTDLIAPCESLEMYVTGISTSNVEIFPLASIWNENNTTGIINHYIQSGAISIIKKNLENYTIEGAAGGIVQLFDISGRMLKKISVENAQTTINLSDIMQDIVLVYVITESERAVFKILR